MGEYLIRNRFRAGSNDDRDKDLVGEGVRASSLVPELFFRADASVQGSGNQETVSDEG